MQDSAVVTTGTLPQRSAAGCQQSKGSIAVHSCDCIEKESCNNTEEEIPGSIYEQSKLFR